MGDMIYLVKRNSLVFLRERSAVFFSLLSMLITLGLMVVFLGRMNSESLVNILAQYGGERDREKRILIEPEIIIGNSCLKREKV